jgi:beta-galactosidase/beta-glucuronidase
MSQNPPSILPGHIATPWAAQIDPNLPHPEYPRPQMVRQGWQNLNGVWTYAITAMDAPFPTDFPSQIRVPFPIESALSGVKRQLQPDERLWYRRTFTTDPDWGGGRVLLHFGAVDWSCRVFVNGTHVGAHQGGYDPFTFDITEVLRESENELVVSVYDPSDAQPIQRGKQVLKPNFIWYTAVSGIWQTVWLEHVPETYIGKIRLTPDIDHQTLTVKTEVINPKPELTFKAQILDQGKTIADIKGSLNEPLTIPLENPKLWSPDSPHLYDLILKLEVHGEVIDSIQSYFGMRKYSLEHDQEGTLRFFLNNEPLFLYGPLDQGYWPDGHYTPPSDEALRWEINFIKDAGFNMLRKHIKVEPARYYTHCDKVGLIVWQDMISGGISPKPIWFFFAQLFKGMRDDRCYWRLGRGSEENRHQFRREYQRMIDALYNVVSIAI